MTRPRHVCCVAALVVGFLLLPLTAFAEYISFADGPDGPLGTAQLTIQGVQLSAVGGQFYREVGDLCCDHFDAGLGVLGPHEPIDAAHPELNFGEWIRIWGSGITSVHLNSVNNGAFGVIIPGYFPVGPGYLFSTAQANDEYELDVHIDAKYNNLPLWVHPLDNHDNFFLVGGVERSVFIDPQCRADCSTVPEPTSCLLLGSGLLGLLRLRVSRRVAR